MRSVFKKKCFGCEQSRLSQLDHTCITLTNKQQLELYFEDILLEVDESNILMKWREAATAVLGVSEELLEISKQKIYSKEWHETVMKTLHWKTKMIQMTVHVLLLEDRLNGH